MTIDEKIGMSIMQCVIRLRTIETQSRMIGYSDIQETEVERLQHNMKESNMVLRSFLSGFKRVVLEEIEKHNTGFTDFVTLNYIRKLLGGSNDPVSSMSEVLGRDGLPEKQG